MQPKWHKLPPVPGWYAVALLYTAVGAYIESLNRAYRNKTELPFVPKYFWWYGKLEG